MRCNPHYNSHNKRAQRSQILVESDGKIFILQKLLTINALDIKGNNTQTNS